MKMCNNLITTKHNVFFFFYPLEASLWVLLNLVVLKDAFKTLKVSTYFTFCSKFLVSLLFKTVYTLSNGCK
jgi:hypothetical protein